MTHIKTIFSIFLLLCIAKPANAVSDDLKQWLNKLDESLEKAPMYQGRRIKLNFPSTAYLSSPHSIPLSVVLG